MQRLNGKCLSCLLVVATLSACTLSAPIVPTSEPAVATVTAAPPLSVQQPPQPALPIQNNEAQLSVNNPLTPEQTQLLAGLPSKGAAPELTNAVWFNSAPLKLADLRGKVVMIEFWTFG